VANSVTRVVIRVNSTFGASYANIGEVEFRNSSGTLLSNSGITATASSTYLGWDPARMLDGNTDYSTGSWSSSGSSLPVYAYFDFSTAQDVASVRIINATSGSNSEYVQGVVVTATHTGGATSSNTMTRPSSADGAHTDHPIPAVVTPASGTITATTSSAVARFSGYTPARGIVSATTGAAVASVFGYIPNIGVLFNTTDASVASVVGYMQSRGVLSVATEDATSNFSAFSASVAALNASTSNAVASFIGSTTYVFTLDATTDDAVASVAAYIPLFIAVSTSSSDTSSASIVASTGHVSITDSASDMLSISAFGTSIINLIGTAQAIDLATFIDKAMLIATEKAVDTVSSKAIGRYTVSDSAKDIASVVGTAFITSTVTTLEHSVDTVTPWGTAVIVDSSTSTDTAKGQAFGHASVVDQAASIDTWLKTLVVTVEAIDQTGEESSIDPHVIGLATILEQIRDLASVNSANRSQFTYTLNTILNAGTRYGNYGFNSFAATDTACYGANNKGLFLLQGASDNGLSIDAVLKTNLSDLAIDGVIEGSKQKTVSDAYVGYTSSGNLVLRVTTSNGGAVSSNDYALVKHGKSSPDVSRVLFGRGVRARYWQFTIENTNGEAFEFDKIEFLPVVLTRRI
jgi:hypothetical protein